MIFNGMRIKVSNLIKPVPKIQLSRSFIECSDEMKSGMNAWLLEKFGTYTPCFVIGNEVVMSQKHFDELQLQAKREEVK